MNFEKIIPAISWLKEYNIGYLKSDMSAGLTVGIMLIPQGMAYALIAGLPPVFGLYAALIPQIVYSLLGTSRQLSVGPVAMDSLLVASGLSALKISGIEQYISMALFLAFFMGSIQFILGNLRMGFLVNFLSRPVISGFTSAAAIIIGLSQLKYIFGISLPKSNAVHILLIESLKNLKYINFEVFGIALFSMLILVLSSKFFPKMPGALLAIIFSTLIVYFFKLDKNGVSIIGEVPSGLPKFSYSFLDINYFGELLILASSLALIAYMEAISVAKTMEEKHGNYRINPNKELIALGAANMAGAFFQAYPTTGGFSRTAVNNQAGAKTGMSSIFSALIIALTLLFFTDFFYYLPNATLGAIILFAVSKLIDLKFPKQLWKFQKDEFALYIITFILTLFFGIKEGILYGVGLSLVFLIYRVSYPHIAILGKIPNSDIYRNIERFKDLEQSPGLLIVRFDAPLFFANSNYFKDYILQNLNNTKWVIVDASAINSIDSTSIKMLTDLEMELKNKEIELLFADVKGPVRDILSRIGLLNEKNSEHYFLSVEDAVKYTEMEKIDPNKKYILQAKS